MSVEDPFYIRKGNVFAVPVVHYSMEFAAQVKLAFDHLKPDCVAVELPETMRDFFIRAAARLPDISLVCTQDENENPIYFLSEPCEGTFEGLRCGIEADLPVYCIDLDVDFYPEMIDHVPDPYSIQRLGLKHYYELFQQFSKRAEHHPLDHKRELHMAKRLKELSFSYDRILFLSGLLHIPEVLKLIDRPSFPEMSHASRREVELATLTEESCREVMAESAWVTVNYEETRKDPHASFPPDRQKLIYRLFKKAGENYLESGGASFPGYHMRNLMKFARNYALYSGRLMPDLYQILAVAKGCVDHNFAYEVWDLSTSYPYLKNVDNLPEKELSIEEIWGHSRFIYFHLKQQSKKASPFLRRKQKDRTDYRFSPPSPFSICSYQPEDLIIERFGGFLRKKATQILSDQGAHTAPFTGSLEDGVDIKETIRHWPEKKLYVKIRGKPPGETGSVVVIFEEDAPEEETHAYNEQFPWCTTWLGEHDQESDMAFYATPMGANLVGPGISRCTYGGFVMSYPPRRMMNVWTDEDYQECRTKAEVLLMAGIDYAVDPVIVYVAAKPPRKIFKHYAAHFGKKLLYLPIGQLSPVTLNKIRAFHVLDGHHRRLIADEYID